MLEFRILGPLEVLADGAPVSLPRKKQRALLALLLMRAGEAVSTDELIEELWAGKPPATARDALQNYVSQLRKALGPEVIVTRDPGYLLDATAAQTDLGRFERLVAEARDEDAKARAEKLREALGLWRGPPLADLAYEAFTGLEMARLEELRASAQADLVDAELELGRHGELVAELETTIAERPFDERLRAQLMLALYRSGRQADALKAYSHARRTLDEELGLEPGAQLRELEQAILRQDAALEAPLAAPVGLEERRKTVTILFADLVESTELAEALDPESLRRVLDGYFAAARRAIESHGGTIEKFIGDAVMAVFGVPVAHEDDALRAVRAGIDIRAAVAALSQAVEREHGLTLDLRIGINTGDVYVGDPGHGGLVTGNAVTVAKRIEQAAPSGAIMLSAGTLELVRDAVQVKAVRPRREKPLPAFRLLELMAGAPSVARYLEAELVGREDELRRLLAAFDVAKREPPSQVVTVLGEPGIGKTRLANELIALVESDATVLTGRCISYGEGATYLPLREMVEGLDLATVLAEAEDAELIAQRVLELVGLADGTAPAGEGAWAVRRFFEALAGEHPLLLVFEDVQWAEPTLLDLIEELAERASGPILAVCIARPELLDQRPSWVERALVLEPLANDESVALLASLPGGDELTAEARQRIVEVTAGNPLFAEQLFAHVDERGSAALDDVPPSVEALLESRLDLLAGDERTLLQRAAVIGREFTLRALVDLSPAEAAAALPSHLFELVRKGLVRPARAPAGEEAFRFHHVLVRDVAYNGLPRADRARLHERLADWLAGEPDPLDEIVGYHLEQAYRNRAELGPPNRRARQLAADAGAHLGAAGMRSWRSGDVPATINLLGRATSLLPENEPWRRELLCELGVAFEARGETDRAVTALTDAVAAAELALDTRLRYRAQLELALVRYRSEPSTADALLSLAQRAIPVLEETGDDRALGRAWLFSGWIDGGHFGRHAEWEDAAERALVHYRLTPFPSARCLGNLGAALYYGPAPVPRAIGRCHELLGEADQIGTANVRRYLGGLMAMAGRLDEARELLAESRSAFAEFGQVGAASFSDSILGDVELLAGDVDAAVRAWGALADYCKEAQDVGALSTTSADLAEALYRAGEHDEAEHWCRESEKYAAADDIGAQYSWRAVRAKVLAQRGALDEAERLAREAIRLAETTDALNKLAAVFLALGEVLRLGGQTSQADEALAHAIALYEQKGNLAAAERATSDTEARGPSRSLSP